MNIDEMGAGRAMDALVAEPREQISIDEIPAGRRMDALVAERVMDYQCVCDDEPCDCPIHAKDDYHTLLPYSTNIAAAWRIVETLAADGRGQAAALAICRAALKLRGGK